MRPHGFLNGVRVAREERLIHAVVPLKKLLRRVQRTPLLKHEVLGNHPAGTAGNGDEQGVAGPFEDRFMEGRAECRVILEGRAGKHALFHAVKQGFQIFPRAFGQVQDYVDGGGPFEEPAQFVAVADAVAREQGYALAPLRVGHQEPLRFKLLKRLTDGGPADAAFLGYAGLADPIPAAEFAVADPLADKVDHLFAVCRFVKLLHRSPLCSLAASDCERRIICI